MQLADIVGDKALHAMLLETTFRNLRILLLSERLKTETSERSLLKNLGSWLGKLTLARNKPILFKDLDLKTILYDAYEQGKMIAVLPFINKARPPLCISHQLPASGAVWPELQHPAPLSAARHVQESLRHPLDTASQCAGAGAVQGQQGVQAAQPLAPGHSGAGGRDLLPGQAEAEPEV